MSEKKTILPQVKVSMEIRGIVDELRFIEVKGAKIEVMQTVDIVREALAKGLKLMLLEREILRELMEAEAVEGVKRIHASLIEGRAGTARVPEVNEMEEMEEEEEEEEEE